MTLKRQLLNEQWNIFCREVLCDPFPSELHEDMRMAFYSGAHAVFDNIIGTSLDDKDADIGEVFAVVSEELCNYICGTEQIEVIQ